MRAMVSGLPTPFPLGALLPSVLQEDPTAMRLTAAMDDVLAPVVATLDCLTSYVDPCLAPPDFVEWLGDWVGETIDENWSIERQRAVIANAVELNRFQGTVGAMRRYLEATTGLRVEVVDSGGVVCGATPDTDPPGEESPHVVVRVVADDGGTVDVETVDAVVRLHKPAHVIHDVVVVHSGFEE